jgi:hypothetical protein
LARSCHGGATTGCALQAVELMRVRRTKVYLSLEPAVLKPLRIPQGTSSAFSIVDPAGTWAWRSGPVDAAAVQRRAEAALLPVEAAVQLRAEAAALAELPRRGEAAVQGRAEAAVAE